MPLNSAKSSNQYRLTCFSQQAASCIFIPADTAIERASLIVLNVVLGLHKSAASQQEAPNQPARMAAAAPKRKCADLVGCGLSVHGFFGWPVPGFSAI